MLGDSDASDAPHCRRLLEHRVGVAGRAPGDQKDRGEKEGGEARPSTAHGADHSPPIRPPKPPVRHLWTNAIVQNITVAKRAVSRKPAFWYAARAEVFHSLTYRETTGAISRRTSSTTAAMPAVAMPAPRQSGGT